MAVLLFGLNDAEGVIAAVIAVALCVLGIIYAVQNARRSVHYSLRNTRFYRAEIVGTETFSTSVYVRWKPRESTVYSVHVQWTDKNGETQSEVIETQNQLLGKRCMHGGSIRIAEVTSRGKRRKVPVSAAPKPMTFSPDPRGGLSYASEETAGNTADDKAGRLHFSPLHLFKSYFGVRDDEPIVQPIAEHEVMFASQWRMQKLYSFLYALMLLPIVLLLAVLLISFILVPLVHALGYQDLDEFFAHLRG